MELRIDVSLIFLYTVRHLVREGKIPAFKIGGQWRFDTKEIEDWRKNQGKRKYQLRRL